MTTDVAQFAGMDLNALSRVMAEQTVTVVNDYNAKVKASEPAEGEPTKADMFKKTKDSVGTPEAPEAKKLVDAYDRALATLAKARTEVQKYGASLLNVDWPGDAEETTDEEKEAATTARKQLIQVLKIAQQTNDKETQAWAESFRVPNIGKDGYSTIVDEGKKRHRVAITVSKGEGEDAVTHEFESFSALALAPKKLLGAKLDTDKLREAYERNDEADTTVTTEGWTVTIVKDEK